MHRQQCILPQPVWEPSVLSMQMNGSVQLTASDHSRHRRCRKSKVKSAKETMNAMNPDVTVNTYREFVTSENIMDLIKDYDFIIDGTDNFPAKFLINDACVMAKKPFSHAGIIRFKGQLMTYVPGEGPCYRCVFKNPPPKDAVPTCKQAGVIGAMGVSSDPYRRWKPSST